MQHVTREILPYTIADSCNFIIIFTEFWSTHIRINSKVVGIAWEKYNLVLAKFFDMEDLSKILGLIF